MNKLEKLLGLEPIYKKEDLKKSPIKWAGGKSKLLPTLLPLIKGKRLFEPFMGSCVVGLNSDIDNIHLNDFNNDLIYLFTNIKTNKEKLILTTQSLFNNGNVEELYYINRTRFNETEDPFERASLFLYLNRHGFNGLCRYNSEGLYNVPFGRYDNVYFPSKEIEHTHTILNAKKSSFDNVDFLIHMSKAKSGDVIYCDPPYVPITQASNFVNYSKDGFSLEQQKDLADMAEALRKKRITTIISNHDTEFSRDIYKNCSKIIEIDVSRTISQKADSRVKVKEIIVVF